MNSTREILYLSYDGLTDPLGQSQILPYLVGLSSNGNKFVIVSFEKRKNYLKLKEEIEILCHNSNITWVPLQYHKWPPVFSTLFDLWTLSKTVKEILNHNRIEIIHCRSYITSLVGLAAKKRTGIKFIFDMRGFWADERVEGGLWSLKNPIYKTIYKYFKGKERTFLEQADHVVSLTRSAKNEMESWNIKVAPISVIPTCVDIEVFDPEKIKVEEQNTLRTRLRFKSDDFILMYLGSWGTWYLTKDMLTFFSRLKEQRQNAKFLIISQDAIDLKDFAHSQDVVITSAPRNKVPLHVSLADASIFFIRPSFSKKASSATKMAEIMAMNVPVVTNRGWGDVEYLSNLPEANISFVDLSDLENFKMDFAKFRTRDFCSTMFSIEMGISRYDSIYKSLMSNHEQGN